MTRIQLIVTGDLEQVSLHKSLQRALGPGAELTQPQKATDFTSTRVGQILAARDMARTRAGKLAAALVAAIHPQRRAAEPADFAVAIDDLELVNADQPAHVVAYFVEAVRAHVEEYYPSQQTRARVLAALADRASFHLLVPMSEAYFFGETDSLVRAKADKAPCRFQPATDVEAFTVTDPDYEGPPPHGARWDHADRKGHPKRYVQYLSATPGTNEEDYRETREGAAALDTLDWAAVLAAGTRGLFARSLLQDLEDALNRPSAFLGQCALCTARKSGGTLRNA